MARPRQSQRRDQQLNLSLTEAELDSIRGRASDAGMRLAEYARTILLRHRARPRRGNGGPTRIDRLFLLAVSRLGNNLNQISRRLNATRDAAPPSLEPLLRDIRALLNRERAP